jgi:hypothetical protein
MVIVERHRVERLLYADINRPAEDHCENRL